MHAVTYLFVNIRLRTYNSIAAHSQLWAWLLLVGPVLTPNGLRRGTGGCRGSRRWVGEGRYSQHHGVTTRMVHIKAATMRDILTARSLGRNKVTDKRRSKAESNPQPSACQPNQRCWFMKVLCMRAPCLTMQSVVCRQEAMQAADDSG